MVMVFGYQQAGFNCSVKPSSIQFLYGPAERAAEKARESHPMGEESRITR
jgi:hypothetical protein